MIPTVASLVFLAGCLTVAVCTVQIAREGRETPRRLSAEDRACLRVRAEIGAAERSDLCVTEGGALVAGEVA